MTLSTSSSSSTTSASTTKNKIGSSDSRSAAITLSAATDVAAADTTTPVPTTPAQEPVYCNTNKFVQYTFEEEEDDDDDEEEIVTSDITSREDSASSSDDAESDDNDDDDDDDDNPNQPNDGLSDYERLRLERIQRNNERLKQLGLNKSILQPSTEKIKKTKKKIEIGIITRRQQPHRSGKKQIRENDVVLPPPKKKQKVISTRRQPHRSAKKQIQLDLDKDEHKDIPSIVMFQPDTAMEMSNVITRMLEIGIVTPTQVAVRGFSVRLAEKSDLSASTKKDLQQQTLRLCKYGLLARWVLQDGDDDDDDDNRVLQIIRCSGIEGHHPSSKSSWVNERSNPSVRNHRLYNNGKCFVVIYVV